MDRLFCKIFVDSDEKWSSFIEVVNGIFDGTIDGYVILTTWAEIDVMSNDCSGQEFEDPRDWFLGYTFKIELEFESQKVTREQYIQNIGMFLTEIWNQGYKAVAACSFEDELPNNGGYRMR